MKSKGPPLDERIDRMENLGLIDPIDEKGLKKVPPPIPVPDGIAQKLLGEDREINDESKNH